MIPPAEEVPFVPFDAIQAASVRTWPVDPSLQILVDERTPCVKIEDAKGGGAPYFPRLGVCLDRRTGMVLAQEMSGADEAFGQDAGRAVESGFARMARRPARVYFVNPNLRKALDPWLRSIDVPGAVCLMPDYLEQLWSMLA